MICRFFAHLAFWARSLARRIVSDRDRFAFNVGSGESAAVGRGGSEAPQTGRAEDVME